MRLCPKGNGHSQRLDTLLLPPGTFVAAPMEFAVMQPAKGDGEPIADLAPHRPLLGELDVMRIAWRAAADETRLRRHEFQVFTVTLPHWLADEKHRLSALFDRLQSAVMLRGLLTLQFERRGPFELS